MVTREMITFLSKDFGDVCTVLKVFSVDPKSILDEHKNKPLLASTTLQKPMGLICDNYFT